MANVREGDNIVTITQEMSYTHLNLSQENLNISTEESIVQVSDNR